MRWNKTILLIGVFSWLAAMSSSLAGEATLSKILGVPAIGVSGWLFLGHFITLDEELPGGWSNQNSEKKIWYSSLAELAAKAAMLFILLAVVYF